MAKTASYMTEFRSCMTFECKTSLSSSVDIQEVTSHSESNQTMAPQQYASHQELQLKGSSEISPDNQESPISSPGTSMTSSPPLHSETAGEMIAMNDMNQEYSARDPMSDDSESNPNDLSGYQGDQDDLPSPLEQLKCVFEKNGLMGKHIHIPKYSTAENLNASSERNGLPVESTEEQNMYYANELYKCHLCSYSGNSKQHFNMHMNSHFDHKCPFCDYTSRTEGRLKRHVKDFHSETPPDSWAGTKVPRTDGSGGEQSMDDSVSSTGNGKSRSYRCKQCDFVAYQKNDFWEHNKSHIKAEKLLTCPKCAFVTEYKHHLEYHIRNHFGSKPFKCAKCNYSCVNKSMLNSHMKSHSNIYQYRCANCTYATKYCHSLKLHLRKYEHKPSTVLNMDGTPNPYPVIDVYGTRRGPRSKKKKYTEDPENSSVSNAALVPSPPSINYSSVTSLLTPNVPVMYHPQFFNGYHSNMFIRPPTSSMDNSTSHMHHSMPHFSAKPLKCLFCDFVTEFQEVFHKHMLLHATSDNQDLIKLYGINSDSIFQLQDQQMVINNYMQNQRHVRENNTHRTDLENNYENAEAMRLAENRQETLSQVSRFYNERESENRPLKDNLPYVQHSSTQDQKSKDFSVSSIPTSTETTLVNEKGNEGKDHNDKERSVIVSHTSASPHIFGSHEQNHEEYSNGQSQGENKNKAPESSPLDLSHTKSTDERLKNQENASEPVTNIEATNTSIQCQSTSTSNVEMPNANSSHCQSRNRRKGKAFKIDHYIQYNDQAQISEVPPNGNTFPNSQISYDFNLESLQNEKAGYNHFPFGHDGKYMSSAQNPKFLLSEPMHLVASTTMTTNLNADKTEVPRAATSYGQGTTTAVNEQNASNQNQNKLPSENGRRINADSLPTNFIKNQKPSRNNGVNVDVTPIVPKIEVDLIEEDERKSAKPNWQDVYMCTYCDMAFRDCVMYTMHMGYHGYADPFTCNMCGTESKDKVDFFLHIARSAHL